MTQLKCIINSHDTTKQIQSIYQKATHSVESVTVVTVGKTLALKLSVCKHGIENKNLETTEENKKKTDNIKRMYLLFSGWGCIYWQRLITHFLTLKLQSNLNITNIFGTM